VDESRTIIGTLRHNLSVWYRNLITDRWSSVFLWVAIAGLKLQDILSIQFGTSDLPSFMSRPTNFLNPWTTWCAWSNGVVTGCYGTSWNHIGGPYSIFWYWFMILVGLWGHSSFTIGLFVSDQLITIPLMLQRRTILPPYLVTSYILLVTNPQDVPILFLLVAGFWKPWFTILGIISKLPIGATAPVWVFAFTSHTSLQDPTNWSRYALLGVWAFFPLFKLLRQWTGRTTRGR